MEYAKACRSFGITAEEAVRSLSGLRFHSEPTDDDAYGVIANLPDPEHATIEEVAEAINKSSGPDFASVVELPSGRKALVADCQCGYSSEIEEARQAALIDAGRVPTDLLGHPSHRVSDGPVIDGPEYFDDTSHRSLASPEFRALVPRLKGRVRSIAMPDYVAIEAMTGPNIGRISIIGYPLTQVEWENRVRGELLRVEKEVGGGDADVDVELQSPDEIGEGLGRIMISGRVVTRSGTNEHICGCGSCGRTVGIEGLNEVEDVLAGLGWPRHDRSGWLCPPCRPAAGDASLESKFSEAVEIYRRRQLAKDMADDLHEMAEQGYVRCKLCGHRFDGDNWGEVLQALGEHGEEKHPGHAGPSEEN
jgi:hypothetical protein